MVQSYQELMGSQVSQGGETAWVDFVKNIESKAGNMILLYVRLLFGKIFLIKKIGLQFEQ